MQTPLSFREHVPLREFCTFGIGGPARYLAEVRTIEEMQHAILWCKQSRLPYLVIGKGSNCLFDDKGFSGVVLVNKIDFFEQPIPGTFHVGAGYSFALLGVQTARQGWGGLEFASGIPATVGGAVFMNAGANRSETCQTIASVDFVNEEGHLEVIAKQDLSFSYRRSPFQGRGGAIVGATFVLTKTSDARKKQIEIVNGRKLTQPYGEKSAGCVFLNPVNGHAGALIEQCNLKGQTSGGAQVSEVHANFLINAGNATCRDMQALIALVQDKVKSHAGVELHSEVRYIPYCKDGS